MPCSKRKRIDCAAPSPSSLLDYPVRPAVAKGGLAAAFSRETGNMPLGQEVSTSSVAMPFRTVLPA